MDHRRSDASVTVGDIVGLSLIIILLAIMGGGYLWYRSTLLRHQAMEAELLAAQQRDAAEEAARELKWQQPSIVQPTPQFRILAWNIESGGNDPVVIAEQLAELKGYDIYALSEVRASNVKRYVKAIDEANETPFRFIVSQTGNDDRLAVLFNSSTLELMAYQEVFSFDDVPLNDWNHRSPQVCQFRHFDSKAEFLVVNNHLARVNADL